MGMGEKGSVCVVRCCVSKAEPPRVRAQGPHFFGAHENNLIKFNDKLMSVAALKVNLETSVTGAPVQRARNHSLCARTPALARVPCCCTSPPLPSRQCCRRVELS